MLVGVWPSPHALLLPRTQSCSDASALLPINLAACALPILSATMGKCLLRLAHGGSVAGSKLQPAVNQHNPLQPSSANACARSWDTWGRMMDPLLSEIALMTLPGNHEIDYVSECVCRCMRRGFTSSLPFSPYRMRWITALFCTIEADSACPVARNVWRHRAPFGP